MAAAASLHDLLVERNRRETDPFVALHQSYASLLQQVDALKGAPDWRAQVEAARDEAQQAQEHAERWKLQVEALQDEKDELQKENNALELRLLNEKTKLIDEMNVLNEMVEGLKHEVDMLRALKKTWLGGKETLQDSKLELSEPKQSSTRRFGSFGVTLPTGVHHAQSNAHTQQGTCVRWANDGLATCANDGTVKVWDAKYNLQATYSTGKYPLLACDVRGPWLVAGGSDKTCRVWKGGRLAHHLVGHAHKITSVQLLDVKTIATASADRCIKLWDIGQQTYFQTTTLRHGSTAQSLDGTDTTLFSAHLDGKLRCWDVRSGERTAEVAVTSASLTSVHVSPTDATSVLVRSLDSLCQVVDLRKNQVRVKTTPQVEMGTTQSGADARWAPNGRYWAAGSSTHAKVFVFEEADASLATVLEGPASAAVDWGPQYLASVNLDGSLVVYS